MAKTATKVQGFHKGVPVPGSHRYFQLDKILTLDIGNWQPPIFTFRQNINLRYRQTESHQYLHIDKTSTIDIGGPLWMNTSSSYWLKCQIPLFMMLLKSFWMSPFQRREGELATDVKAWKYRPSPPPRKLKERKRKAIVREFDPNFPSKKLRTTADYQKEVLEARQC